MEKEKEKEKEKLYLVTHSYMNFISGCIKANADVFTNNIDSLKKIIELHIKFCYYYEIFGYETDILDYGEYLKFSNDFIEYGNIETDPGRILCKECKFILKESNNKENNCENNSENENNIKNFHEYENNYDYEDDTYCTDNTDGLYTHGNIYCRFMCIKCLSSEQMLVSVKNCECQYLKYKKKYKNNNVYKRIICKECSKYCYCTKCNFDIWSFTKLTLQDNTINKKNEYHSHMYIKYITQYPIYVGLTISELSKQSECSTKWDTMYPIDKNHFESNADWNEYSKD
jgi:hypothetical protein